jgi:6-phosphofructokinase 1
MERAARKKAGQQAANESAVSAEMERIGKGYSGETMRLARRLEDETGLQSRITILGALVRGGTPTASDRLLATQLAEWGVVMAENGQFGRMAARVDGAMSSVALEDVVDKHKLVPADHGWVRGAYQVGTCLGVEITCF